MFAVIFKFDTVSLFLLYDHHKGTLLWQGTFKCLTYSATIFTVAFDIFIIRSVKYVTIVTPPTIGVGFAF